MKKYLSLLFIVISLNAYSISKKEVYHLLIKHNVKHKSIVLKQSLLESNTYKSRICKTKHNIFGLRKGNKYRYFKSYEDCIIFYKHWQNKRYTTNKKSKYHKHYSKDYYQFLKNIKYATDKRYISKLKRIKVTKQIKIWEDECNRGEGNQISCRI